MKYLVREMGVEYVLGVYDTITEAEQTLDKYMSEAKKYNTFDTYYIEKVDDYVDENDHSGLYPPANPYK